MEITIEGIKAIIGDFDGLTEAYQVVDTIHVIYRGGQAKFEVYRKPLGSDAYDVFAYRLVSDIWVKWIDFPASYSDSAAGALRRAIGWLGERHAGL